MPEKHSLLKEMAKIAALALRANRSSDAGHDSHDTLEMYREAIALTKPFFEAVKKHLGEHDQFHDTKQRSGRQDPSHGGLIAALAKFAFNKSKKDSASDDHFGVLREMHKLLDVHRENAEEEVIRLERNLTARDDGRRRRRRTDQEKELGRHIGKRGVRERGGGRSGTRREFQPPSDEDRIHSPGHSNREGQSRPQMASLDARAQEKPGYHGYQQQMPNVASYSRAPQAASAHSKQFRSPRYRSDTQQQDLGNAAATSLPPPLVGTSLPQDEFGGRSGPAAFGPVSGQAPYPGDRSSLQSDRSSRMSMPRPRMSGRPAQDSHERFAPSNVAAPGQPQCDAQDFGGPDHSSQAHHGFASNTVPADHTVPFASSPNDFVYRPQTDAPNHPVPFGTADHPRYLPQHSTPYGHGQTAGMPRATSADNDSAYERETRAPTEISARSSRLKQKVPMIPTVHAEPPPEDRSHSFTANAAPAGVHGSRHGSKASTRASSKTESIPRTDTWVQSQARHGPHVEQEDQPDSMPNFVMPGAAEPNAFPDVQLVPVARDRSRRSGASAVTSVDEELAPEGNRSQRYAEPQKQFSQTMPTSPYRNAADIQPGTERTPLDPPNDRHSGRSRTSAKAPSRGSHRSQRIDPGPTCPGELNFSRMPPVAKSDDDEVSEIRMHGYQRPQLPRRCHHKEWQLEEFEIDPEECKSLAHTSSM